ncbi:SMP-30/gluconolactonase/LRE family protein [Microbacterium sp. Leaf159]|uniref:SMP-30/gluconolactonase/LRE family protein n=1 Tax=Microbacterium sp. Leaf159 TaxID=1736279 RepID=UPI0006F221BD|nr:SMP-30/gluconolactonase/LRE family protein [Microbacterium sp. Leaf159]KQR39347.1 hypothetical protein ASF80_07990 [Microbacterium sp. Leaf159]
MTATPRVLLAEETACELGEGPVWDPHRQRLLWVDINRALVMIGVLEPSGRIQLVDTVAFEGTVGAVAVAVDGSWIVANGRELVTLDESGSSRRIATLIRAELDARLNDGKPDPVGRFVVGSLSLAGPSSTEILARVDGAGHVSVIDDDLTLSNGLAWSPDGTVMYSVDTERRSVYRRDYEPTTGRVGARETLIRFEEGFPDGICTDEEGCLWIAVWGAGQVRRYTPDGELVTTIVLDVPHVSSVAFAGLDLDVLVITTARQGLTEAQLARHPDSGKLFTTRPGVRGMRVSPWQGLREEKENP